MSFTEACLNGVLFFSSGLVRLLGTIFVVIIIIFIRFYFSKMFNIRLLWSCWESLTSSKSTHLISLSRSLSLSLSLLYFLYSGTSLSPWAFRHEPEADREEAIALGAKVGCDFTDSTQLVDCLRTVYAVTLMNAFWQVIP